MLSTQALPDAALLLSAARERTAPRALESSGAFDAQFQTALDVLVRSINDEAALGADGIAAAHDRL